MHKLVTIYLNSVIYADKKLKSDLKDKHGLFEEHLNDYLNDGWKIKEISSFGSAVELSPTAGFVIVALEKE